MCYGDDALPPDPPVTGVVGDHGELFLLSADGTEFAAYYAYPQARARSAVVVMPDVRGLHRFYQELAAAVRRGRLARHCHRLLRQDDRNRFAPRVTRLSVSPARRPAGTGQVDPRRPRCGRVAAGGPRPRRRVRIYRGLLPRRSDVLATVCRGCTGSPGASGSTDGRPGSWIRSDPCDRRCSSSGPAETMAFQSTNSSSLPSRFGAPGSTPSCMCTPTPRTASSTGQPRVTSRNATTPGGVFLRSSTGTAGSRAAAQEPARTGPTRPVGTPAASAVRGSRRRRAPPAVRRRYGTRGRRCRPTTSRRPTHRGAT